MMEMYWKLVTRADVRARMLADKHYSRQHPGTPCFTPPGNVIILLGLNDDALWASHRPDPKANLAQKRRDGFDYYDNPYFRREPSCPMIASELIMQALAITNALWSDYDPPDGFHSFVDPRKVNPTMRRGKPVYGWCFEKAGFEVYPERTKARGLLRLVMPLGKLRLIPPQFPMREQLRLFA